MVTKIVAFIYGNEITKNPHFSVEEEMFVGFDRINIGRSVFVIFSEGVARKTSIL